ncbi:unnamed protein product [Tilletia controversa]|nr:unnamed protein product [Tilletia controversa]
MFQDSENLRHPYPAPSAHAPSSSPTEPAVDALHGTPCLFERTKAQDGRTSSYGCLLLHATPRPYESSLR